MRTTVIDEPSTETAGKGVPSPALEDAFRKLTRVDAPSLVERNHAVHRAFDAEVRILLRMPPGFFERSRVSAAIG